MAAATQFYGTGRRKTSVARVWLRPGGGRILVNRRPFEDYFPRETLRMIIAQPLQLTNTFGTLDATINVGGGGPTGQAGAVRHGTSPGRCSNSTSTCGRRSSGRAFSRATRG